MNHHTDPDPTPAHGTPRPVVKPCDALGCDFFTTVQERFCHRHKFLLPFTNAGDFVNSWLMDTADTAHPADRFACLIIDNALNALYGFFTACQLGDSDALLAMMNKTAPIFGFAVCDECGDFSTLDQMNAHNVCEGCQDLDQYA
jgi:hypothetical protein